MGIEILFSKIFSFVSVKHDDEISSSEDELDFSLLFLFVKKSTIETRKITMKIEIWYKKNTERTKHIDFNIRQSFFHYA